MALIPDGNRRWARKRGWLASLGHREGAKSAGKVLEAALELKIPYITLWGCSVSNLTNRSKAEVSFLYQVFAVFFKKLLNDRRLKENEVRVRILGRWPEYFPVRVREILNKLITDTARYDKYNLTLLLGYDGREEMLQAVEGLVATKRNNPKLAITGESLKQNLWTKDLPPVDLVIRTGGEPHWSAGFLMWDVAEARLHFTETLWPAFSPTEFKNIVGQYYGTERRHGK